MSQEPSPDKYGAAIHKGKLMDAEGWQDTDPQEYVAAADYEALRQRFERACAEITRLSAPSHVADSPAAKNERDAALRLLAEMADAMGLSLGDSESVAKMRPLVLARLESAPSTTPQKPVAWRYRYEGPGVVMEWRYVDFEEECNDFPDYKREPLYAASAIAPRQETLKLAEQWKGRADDAGLLARAILNG